MINWDEKPPAYKCTGTMVYSQLEMDDFLAKVKAEYDKFKKFYDRYTTHFVFEKAFDPPKVCPECGEKIETWVDGTIGCKNGHVIASKLEGEFFFYVLTFKEAEKVIEKLEAVKRWVATRNDLEELEEILEVKGT